MCLKYINRAYWYIGIILYSFFSLKNIESKNSFYLYFVSFIVFILFGIIVSEACKRKAAFFTKQNLVLTVSICSVLEVILYQALSFNIDGDTFVFSKSDSLDYFNESIKMSKMGVKEGFDYISQMYDFDDWGAFAWISTIFRIIPSKFFLAFSYCVIGSISAAMLFDIGRCLMPRRYAYMAALTFSIASFITVSHAMCLKETIFLFSVIASFHSFYLFLRCKRAWHIVLTILCIASTLLFRVPVALLLALSFGLTLVLIYSKGLLVTMLSILLVLFIYSSSFFTITYKRYLAEGDVSRIIERKNELAGGGGIVNQLADPLAALIGPFPSIAIKEINTTPLNASGLLYRLLLAGPFAMGAYYIFRYKYKKMYPFVIFFLINAIGVAISVKGLEARLSVPHLAMMYMVAFWCLAMYDYRRIRLRASKTIINCCFFIVLILCLMWNMRIF